MSLEASDVVDMQLSCALSAAPSTWRRYGEMVDYTGVAHAAGS